MYIRRLFFALFLCIPLRLYAWQTPAIPMMAQVPSVPVPDFKGKTYKEVQALAIDPRTKRSLFANITPIGPIDGVVATQSPEKGTPVYPGRSPLAVTLEPPKPSPLQNFLQQLATAAQNNEAKKPRPVGAEAFGTTSEDSLQFGRFLREIVGARSVDCLPQGLYPSKMIGAAFLNFIEASGRIRSAQTLRLMDDIWLFDDDEKTLTADFIMIQTLLSSRGLSINERKALVFPDAPSNGGGSIDRKPLL
jgi:hypothetical protein